MQPAELFHRLVPRPQEEMVGIGKNDLGIQIIDKVSRQDSLNRSLGPHRHKNRRFHNPMVRMQQPGPRASFGTSGL
jgi:hypothetical protein